MPFLTDQVLFLLVLVDLHQAYFPLHRCHSVTFPSFLYAQRCTHASSSSLHSRQWLDSSECESWAFEPSSFFSAPTEGCHFGKIVRHLYDQKREVALNTFVFSIYRITCAGGLNGTKDLSENFYQFPTQITVCMPKKAVLLLLRDRQARYMKNNPCTSNPAYVQMMQAIFEG